MDQNHTIFFGFPTFDGKRAVVYMGITLLAWRVVVRS